MTRYFWVEQGQLQSSPQPPVGLMPVANAGAMLLPPLAEPLHRHFRLWGDVGRSPGEITPQRVFVGSGGQLAFAFADGQSPASLFAGVGASPDLAAWLVLLDKWMETAEMIQGARAVWSAQELAGALPFVTPAFLPSVLVAYPPENCARVARTLAHALLPASTDAPGPESEPAESAAPPAT